MNRNRMSTFLDDFSWYEVSEWGHVRLSNI